MPRPCFKEEIKDELRNRETSQNGVRQTGIVGLARLRFSAGRINRLPCNSFNGHGKIRRTGEAGPGKGAGQRNIGQGFFEVSGSRQQSREVRAGADAHFLEQENRVLRGRIA